MQARARGTSLFEAGLEAEGKMAWQLMSLDELRGVEINSPEFHLEKYQVYTRKNLTTCNKSADMPSTRCVRTACTKFVNKLFQTC